jgi:mercuric ion binding protein
MEGRSFQLEKQIAIFGGQKSCMKKLLVSLIAFFGLISIGFSQVKKGVQTVTIQTPTVQCENCKKRIEAYMMREPGVQKVNVDYKKKVTKVTFVAERTNIENIKTAIANVGYDADDVAANEDSYQRLPKSCKKPEDGGGVKQKN